MNPAPLGRALLTWVLSILVLSTTASPALATDTDTDIDDMSRIERIAGELEEDRLYIHHTMLGRWSDQELDELRERMASEPLTDLGVHLVAYPSVPTDETGGRPLLFLRALHEVTGDDGVYVAVTADRRTALATFDSPVQLSEVDTGEFRAVTVPHTNRLLDLLEAAPSGPVTSSEIPPDEAASVRDAVKPLERDSERFWTAALFPGVLLGLLLMGVRILFRRPRDWKPLRWPPQPLRPLRLLRARVARLRSRIARLRAAINAPYRARWAPNRPWRWWLRPVLGGELRRLRLLIEAAPADHPERTRAVQAYDAAGLIAQSPGLPPQAVVCAVVVARNGVQLMRHPERPLLEPCQFNPLHGAGGFRLREYACRRRLSWWQVCSRCSRRRVDPRFGPLRPSLPLLVNGEPTHYRHAKDPWAEAIAVPDHTFARVRTELEV